MFRGEEDIGKTSVIGDVLRRRRHWEDPGDRRRFEEKKTSEDPGDRRCFEEKKTSGGPR